MSIPVFISLTSINQNQEILLKTLISIKKQTFPPLKCYIHLSEEPYLLDTGFKNKIITNEKLKELLEKDDLFEIVWTKNIGPYRKLIPILKEKWNDDCLIITIDDDTEYHPNLVKNLLFLYSKYQCVISFRGFTLNHNNGKLTYENRNKLINLNLYNFFTGKGSVLYNPKFFHKTDNLIFDENLFLSLCKTTDDVWFNLVRICNNINCYVYNTNYMTKDNTSKFGLYNNFNSKNLLNTNNISQTIKKLNELNYHI
jgi:hypothetical protein